MYRFSIVVPLLGNVSLFEATLASVLRTRPAACQVIVAHDGTYQDPHGLAGEVDFVSTNRKSGLIELFNCGLQVARGKLVGLIRPGVHLSDSWDLWIATEFTDPNVGSVSPAIVADRQTDRLVTAGVSASQFFARQLVGVNHRLGTRRGGKLNPFGPSSWCAFYRRSLLTSLGGCDEQLDPHFLDLDLALSLRNLDFKCIFCSECIVKTDDEAAILQEARLPHGKSAQRSLLRHQDLTTSSRRLGGTIFATLGDVLTSPVRPSRLRHAAQRIGAISMAETDHHHLDLVTVLKKQRKRLVETGEQPEQSKPFRRAA